jgi:hypothetical protein
MPEPEWYTNLRWRRCSGRVRISNAYFVSRMRDLVPTGTSTFVVRAHFSTALDVDETEEDVPPAKRCGNAEETWSFNFATGEIRQVANTQPLQLQSARQLSQNDRLHQGTFCARVILLFSSFVSECVLAYPSCGMVV